MRQFFKALAIGGLALCVSPFSSLSFGQGYVDVEAERAATKTASPDASSAQPAPSQPRPTLSTPPPPVSTQSTSATSYGLDSSAPTRTVTAAPTPLASPGMGSTGGDQSLGNLFYQLQLLQQEVMKLNGQVEEQAYELRRMKEQNIERYVDIDGRLSALAGGTAAVPSTTVSGGTTTRPAYSGGSESPGEGDAYRAAYAKVKAKQFDQAISAFKQFLQEYPAGKYAANAYYWLGELYLVVDPQDLEASRQSFTLLLDQYPDNAKAPDAMYKLGMVHFMKGNSAKAKEYFDRVINEYGSTNNSAVKLAKDFLSENY